MQPHSIQDAKLNRIDIEVKSSLKMFQALSLLKEKMYPPQTLLEEFLLPKMTQKLL